MALTESQVVALELERVIPEIRTLFDRDDTFFQSIKGKNIEKVSSRQMRVPLEISPGGDFGYFNPDGGDLGRGSGSIMDKAVLTPVYMSENIEYTKQTQWGTDSSRKAIENSVRWQTAKAFDEIKTQLDNQMQQPGTGVIGTVTTDTPSGGENVIVMTTDGWGANLMRTQQTIQVYDSTLATLRGSGTITFWDVENKTIKVSPQIAGVTTDDVIVTRGISAPASLPALYGVPYHHSNASTGTWLGFDRASTPQIRANAVDAGGGALSLPLPRLAINKIANRLGLEHKFAPQAWMHLCQKQAYEQIGQLVSIIQKKASEEGLNMYFGDNMQMAGAPVRCSIRWNRKRIDFVTASVWGRGEILPLGFYKTDGRHIFEIRGASGGVATADIFYMVIGTQTFVNNPAACSYIDDLAIPSGY